MPTWQPLPLEEAEALWHSLGSINNRILKELPQDAKNVWLIAENGQKPVGVVLLKDHRLATCAISRDDHDIPTLPRISFWAGANSVFQSLASLCISRQNTLYCSDDGAFRIPEQLRRLFLHHATRPRSLARKAADYDPTRSALTVKSAESIVHKAFYQAVKRTRPGEAPGFIDGWAAAALNFVTGDKANYTLLDSESLHTLELLRERNVHRLPSDLVSEARMIDERLTAELERTLELAERCLEEDRPYLNARHASMASFQAWRTKSLCGMAKNLKPFSQRLIKGLILATVAGARLSIGTLSEAISTSLADYYSAALPLMQDVEIVAAGRIVAEFITCRDADNVSGIFVLCHPSKVVLPNPRVVLKSEVVKLDPRTVYHEFEHARQYLAGDEPIGNFQATGKYETEIIEWKAKQAEADLIDQFGILY